MGSDKDKSITDQIVTKPLASGTEDYIDWDDPKYRSTPGQQVLSSCTGALITSLLGKYLDYYFIPQ